ncbi:shikimate dehydrogenase family protein [Ruegeria atlantica]|uniref:shikimate dehydrogenase family protein n=1 Tax=Ruegeria atlantica TaxID=81569 RepID=UPI00147EF640|nr:hypothetical protein [Ruegeria atlantica]
MDTETTLLSVSSETLIVPVFGNPVSETDYPVLLSDRAAQFGHNTLFIPVDVDPDGLRKVLEGFRHLRNWAGLVITEPHDAAVLEYVDHISESAGFVGSANIVRVEADGAWVADVTDGKALVRELWRSGVIVKERAIHIFGCGRAGAAVAHAVAQAGAAEVSVSDCRVEKAETLVSKLSNQRLPTTFRVGTDNIRAADIVINTSSTGTQGRDGVNLLSRHQVFVEMDGESEPLKAECSTKCAANSTIRTINSQVDAILDFLGMLPITYDVSLVTRQIWF